MRRQDRCSEVLAKDQTEDSSKEKTDSSEEGAAQEGTSSYSSFVEIKKEVLTNLTPSGTVVTLEDLTDEVHKRTGYSVESVRESIERLVKRKWIEKDGQFVKSLIDSYPA